MAESSSSQRTLDLLSRRLHELDESPVWWPSADERKTWSKRRLLCARITHFADVMTRQTDAFMDYEAGTGAMVDPAVADAW
jgi:hypothetical protein